MKGEGHRVKSKESSSGARRARGKSKKEKVRYRVMFAREIVTVLSASILVCGLSAGEAKLEVKLERSVAKLGEEVRLRVSARITAGAEARLLPLENDEFLARIEPGPGETAADELRWQVIVRPLAMGEIEIPPLELEVKGPGARREIVRSRGFKLTVSGHLRQDEKPVAEDIVGPSRQGYPAGLWAWPLALVLAALVFVYLWRRRGFREESMLAAAIEPPEERARRGLAELKKIDTGGEEAMREYYSRLSLVMRDYLGRRYDFSALECTTAEIRRRLGKAEEAFVAKKELGRLLGGSDLVKFARRRFGPIEAKADLDLALKVIDMTSSVSEEEKAGTVSG